MWIMNMLFNTAYDMHFYAILAIFCLQCDLQGFSVKCIPSRLLQETPTRLFLTCFFNLFCCNAHAHIVVPCKTPSQLSCVYIFRHLKIPFQFSTNLSIHVINKCAMTHQSHVKGSNLWVRKTVAMVD